MAKTKVKTRPAGASNETAPQMNFLGLQGGSDRLEGQIRGAKSLLEVAQGKLDDAEKLREPHRTEAINATLADITKVIDKTATTELSNIDTSINLLDRERQIPSINPDAAHRQRDEFAAFVTSLPQQELKQFAAAHRLQEAMRDPETGARGNPTAAEASLIQLASEADGETVAAVTNAGSLFRRRMKIGDKAIEVATAKFREAAYPKQTEHIREKQRERQLYTANHNVIVAELRKRGGVAVPSRTTGAGGDDG